MYVQNSVYCKTVSTYRPHRVWYFVESNLFNFSQVHETAGRDCKPGQLEDMVSTLQAWCDASDRIADEIVDKISTAEQAQELESKRVKEFATKV